ncbi:MAG TPA: hypothetical protein VJA16_07650 [Thermoanaerobaculia bacterium]
MAEKPKAEDPAPPARRPRRKRASGGDFVASVVSDPADPPHCVVVGGYLGASSEEDHVRLYLRPDLADHLDIPEDAVLHQMDIDGDPFGGVYLWVKRDAEAKYKRNCG